LGSFDKKENRNVASKTSATKASFTIKDDIVNKSYSFAYLAIMSANQSYI
jgi:hypothetical protein